MLPTTRPQPPHLRHGLPPPRQVPGVVPPLPPCLRPPPPHRRRPPPPRHPVLDHQRPQLAVHRTQDPVRLRAGRGSALPLTLPPLAQPRHLPAAARPHQRRGPAQRLGRHVGHRPVPPASRPVLPVRPPAL